MLRPEVTRILAWPYGAIRDRKGGCGVNSSQNQEIPPSIKEYKYNVKPHIQLMNTSQGQNPLHAPVMYNYTGSQERKIEEKVPFDPNLVHCRSHHQSHEVRIPET